MFQTLLVPGYKLLEKDRPDDIFLTRLEAAEDLALNFDISILIVSGKGHGKRTEAEVGVEYLQSRNRLPSFTHVIKEEYSNETIGNYIFSTAAFINPLRSGRVITVTTPDQSNRCHDIARHIWSDRVNHAVFTALPKQPTDAARPEEATAAKPKDVLLRERFIDDQFKLKLISQFFGTLTKIVCLTAESVAGRHAAMPPPAPAPRVAKLEIGWSEISAASSVNAFSLLKPPQACGAA